jgi:hypothetical protein
MSSGSTVKHREIILEPYATVEGVESTKKERVS